MSKTIGVHDVFKTSISMDRRMQADLDLYCVNNLCTRSAAIVRAWYVFRELATRAEWTEASLKKFLHDQRKSGRL